MDASTTSETECDIKKALGGKENPGEIVTETGGQRAVGPTTTRHLLVLRGKSIGGESTQIEVELDSAPSCLADKKHHWEQLDYGCRDGIFHSASLCDFCGLMVHLATTLSDDKEICSYWMPQ